MKTVANLIRLETEALPSTPAIDKPNERMTIDITLTVPDSMLTLSNGLMTKTSKNTDHTRTDTWVMDQRIAPYLVMIAAGPFARVTDKWNDIPKGR